MFDWVRHLQKAVMAYVKVLLWHSPEQTEEIYKICQVSRSLAEIQTRYLLNTSSKCYCYRNLLSELEGNRQVLITWIGLS
jgi:hypothetical protein